MHILLGLLGILGTIGMILWRIKMAVDAAKHIAKTAGDAQKYMQGKRLQKEAAADPFKDIKDPRISATAILTALASHDGVISECAKNTIIHELKTNLETSELIASQLLDHGRWLSKDRDDLNSFISRLLPPIVRHCSQQEKHDLIRMMKNVASANGEISHIETNAILFVTRHLGL